MTATASAHGARAPAIGFIFFTVLLDVIGIGLIIPILPTLVGTLTESSDQQAYWFGLLIVSFSLAQFLFSPLLGALSDRFGRRPVLLLGIAGLGLNFIVSATANSLWLLLASRIVGGACSANIAVAHAYIADFTPAPDRARRFGMMGAAFGVGFIIGPVIGGLLGEVNVRLPFFAAAGLSLLNGCYGLFILPESLSQEHRQPLQLRKANPLGSLQHLSKLKGLGSLLISIALINLAQFILQYTWVLFATARFDWGPRENGLSLFAAGLAAGLVQGGMTGRLVKRLGVQRLTTYGMISACVAYLLFGLAQHGWEIYAILFGNLLAYAAGPAQQSLVSQAASAKEQGLTMGAVSSLRSLMGVAAPLLAAPLYASVSHLPGHDWRLGATFYLASLMALGALIFVVHYFRHAPIPTVLSTHPEAAL